MAMWNGLALWLKSAAGNRPPLARTLVGPWSTAFGAAPGAGEPPFSYAEQVRAAYLENPVAQRAVRTVAEGVAGAPLRTNRDRLASLVMATSAGQSLLETLAAQLLLHGNGYVQILRDSSGKPQELFALRPDRVTIEPDEQGWPAAFVYRVGDHVTRFAAAEGDGAPALIHIRCFNPVDDHYGLGCLGAAARPVAVHNAASSWNRSLLDNAARPSGALIYEPGDGAMPLSAEQFDRLKGELAASFSGRGNAGRPMLLEGGLRWQSMGLTPADMDFVALKASAARDIALAFGVPPMLLGLPGDNTYANYREANRALWRMTLLPLADKILSALAEALRFWWPDADLAVDLDRVPALAEDRERLWSQVSAADFLSAEEKRALLGLGDIA